VVRKIPLDFIDLLFINEVEGTQLTGEQNPEAIGRSLPLRDRRLVTQDKCQT
jgi:hypothetical protein